MTIHYLSQVRVRSARRERLPWTIAMPLMIGLSVAGWGVLAAAGLGLWRITGL